MLVYLVNIVVIFSQYLVTYFVPGVKGLPGGVDLVCHAGLDPLGIIIECRVPKSLMMNIFAGICFSTASQTVVGLGPLCPNAGRIVFEFATGTSGSGCV